MNRSFPVATILVMLAGLTLDAAPTLPVVEEVEWPPFRDHCRQSAGRWTKTARPYRRRPSVS